MLNHRKIHLTFNLVFGFTVKFCKIHYSSKEIKIKTWRKKLNIFHLVPSTVMCIRKSCILFIHLSYSLIFRIPEPFFNIYNVDLSWCQLLEIGVRWSIEFTQISAWDSGGSVGSSPQGFCLWSLGLISVDVLVWIKLC